MSVTESLTQASEMIREALKHIQGGRLTEAEEEIDMAMCALSTASVQIEKIIVGD